MEKTTLRTLRCMVGATKGKALPTARALRESGSSIVVSMEVADGSLTVYESGFYTYATPAGTTVYAVDRCADYAYEGGDMLPEELFEDEGWAIRLLLAGEDRLEHNNDAREQGNHFSYSADITERGDLRDPHDFVAELENRDLVERMIACLTEKQQQIVRLYFFEGMTQRQVASFLGMRQPSVVGQIRAIEQKMKKTF